MLKEIATIENCSIRSVGNFNVDFDNQVWLANFEIMIYK